MVTRTADVLRALTAARGGLTLSELAAAVALPASSVHRLVAALDEEGLVRAQPRGRIFLGPLITQRPSEGEVVPANEVREMMRGLSCNLQETVDVAILDGSSIRFVAQSTVGERFRAVSAVGVRFPLYCTSSGKAFLARMGRDRAAVLLPGRLKRHTARTMTSRRALWRELEEVRRYGVGFDREEHRMGIASLATLVTDSCGLTVAISVVTPAVRFYDREEELSAAVLAAAAAVRQRLVSAGRKSRSH
jgi:DNA-binding IclR family transcriptional regulator